MLSVVQQPNKLANFRLFPHTVKNPKHKGQFQMSSSCLSRCLLALTKTHLLQRKDFREHVCTLIAFPVTHLIEHIVFGFAFEYRRYRGDFKDKIIEFIQPACR